MKKMLIIATLAVLIACQKQAPVNAGLPILAINALVYGDRLPADGCGSHLWLNFDNFSSDSRTFMRLPTAATRILMDEVVKAEVAKHPVGTLWMSNKEVIIQYRDVDQTATLTCGWGKKQELKTIELLSLKAR